MDPSHNKQHDLSLPPPSFEVPMNADELEKKQPAASPEQSKPVVGADPAQTTSLNIFAQVPIASKAILPSTSLTVPTATPIAASDADLIEKEWVEKAKAIVVQTRDDPRTQSQQVNNLKVDYMKKRYSKDIKIAEE